MPSLSDKLALAWLDEIGVGKHATERHVEMANRAAQTVLDEFADMKASGQLRALGTRYKRDRKAGKPVPSWSRYVASYQETLVRMLAKKQLADVRRGLASTLD